MIQSKNAYYMDIPKTATSYMENCLHHICEPKTLMYHTNIKMNGTQLVLNLAAKHYMLEHFPKEYSIQAKHGVLKTNNINDYNNKLLYTTIRNPWEYYVSEYNYSKHKNWRSRWLKESRDKDFEFWLKHHYTTTLKDDNTVGLLTTSIIRFTDNNFYKKKSSFNEIIQWFDMIYFNNDLRRLIGVTNNLGEEFCELVNEHSDKFDLVFDYKNKLDEIMSKGKAFEAPILGRFNNSNRIQNLDYKSFYTPELVDIVYNNDKILIDRYNFKPEW